MAGTLHAITILGLRNSRLKDYFDLHELPLQGPGNVSLMAEAVVATFERRKTPLPDSRPIGLSDEFANDALKNMQWKAFVSKNRLVGPPLGEVIQAVRNFHGFYKGLKSFDVVAESWFPASILSHAAILTS